MNGQLSCRQLRGPAAAPRGGANLALQPTGRANRAQGGARVAWPRGLQLSSPFGGLVAD